MASSFEKLTGGLRTATKTVGGFRFTSGPIFSRLGYLLFCDVETDRILKWEAGKTITFREKSNGARALTFDHQGRLLACERGRVTRTEKNGEVSLLADRCAGKPLAKPCDLIYSIDGTIYFTDEGRQNTAICRIDRKGAVYVASRDLRTPAGLALAPNQQRLYAADVESGRIHVFEVSGDGSLRNARTFTSATRPRALNTDEEGNVWSTDGDAITVFDSAGKKLGSISVPETPEGCTWGEGFHDLYVTAKTSIYKVRANVNGTRTYYRARAGCRRHAGSSATSEGRRNGSRHVAGAIGARGRAPSGGSAK